MLWATLALPWAGEAQAQDAHYWSTQYGNRSRLLAGAVIGSVDDASSVFYNPGALATSRAEARLTTAAFTRITVILGFGLDL